MIRDLDIYRSANVLIREHGEDAALEAAQRADAMLEKGDLEGQTVWKRIVRAASRLLRYHVSKCSSAPPPQHVLR